MNLKAITPSIYHAFFSEMLDVEIPNETIATCDNCTVCRSGESPYVGTKCCWYYPHLPNFLIGAILKDNDESVVKGRQLIRDQIKARAGVTPYGTVPPVPYSNRRKKTDDYSFWSVSPELIESLRCPYYDHGNCTIYKYRNSTCTTFYCSSIGGVSGKKFWKKVKTFLKMTETSLAQYAMQQLGWSPTTIKTEAVDTSDFNLEDDLGNLNKEKYAKLWGDWAGREKEFYIKCYEIVSKVDTAKFKQITGVKREISEAAIRETQKDFVENLLPEKLMFNPQVITKKVEDGSVRLMLKEVSIIVPWYILPLIQGFDGKKTTAEVFHLGYSIQISLSDIVDELLEKGILIKP